MMFDPQGYARFTEKHPTWFPEGANGRALHPGVARGLGVIFYGLMGIWVWWLLTVPLPRGQDRCHFIFGPGWRPGTHGAWMGNAILKGCEAVATTFAKP